MLPVGTNLKLEKIPLATVSLLLINWTIFIFLQMDYYKTYYWLTKYFKYIPGEQYPWQLITSMFLHAGGLHILGNSLYLWVFGIFVEDKAGWKAYVFLYFLTGIVANLVHGMMAGLFVRDNLFIPSLGASGAISGIMGVYLYRCYYSKVKLLISLWLPIRVQVPAVIILSLWFLQDFLGGIDSIRGIAQNVAFWAHVGGFVSGLGACKYLKYEIEARKERMEFVVDSKMDRFVGYGEGVEACERLLEGDPEDPELHLKLARAKSRWRASEEARHHYEKAIKTLLPTHPEKAAEVFVDYWRKYLTVMEPRYQASLSRLINKYVDSDLSAKTLQALIESNQPLDLHMEQAYLDLAKIYGQLGRDELAHHVYSRFLQKFPQSRHRAFAEKKLYVISEETALPG